MSIPPVLRVLNLLQALSTVESPRSLEWIQRNVPGYGKHEQKVQTESAYRQLQRDLSVLRDLGIQIQVAQQDEHFLKDSALEQERGNINKFKISGWSQPDQINLSPSEEVLLGALKTWKSENPDLHQQLIQAQLKLGARGMRFDSSPEIPQGTVENFLDLDIDSIMRLYQAMGSGLCISFDYWAHPAAESQRRHLEPWAVATVKGKTYMTGFDKDREEPRTFRLSRIAHIRIEEEIISHHPPTQTSARELIIHGLDRSAVSPVVEFHKDQFPQGEYKALEGRIVELMSEQPYRVRLSSDNKESYARTLASYAPEVTVVEPPELRQEVIEILREALTGSSGEQR